MTRTRLLLASVGLAALLAAAVTGMIYAGPLGQSGDDAPIPDHLERLGEIIQEKEDDGRVLATVNGHSLSVQQLRIAYESHLVVEPDLSEREAIKATILSEVDEVLLASEAESLGLTTTEDEARALLERNRAACEEEPEIEAECRDNMSRMGLDYDEYWEQAVPMFQETQTALKAMDVLRDEYLEREDTGHDGELLDWLVVHEVREDAEIVWHDQDVEVLFQEAHAERGELLEGSE